MKLQWCVSVKEEMVGTSAPPTQVPSSASALLLARRPLDRVRKLQEGSQGDFSAPWPGHAQ